MAIITSVAAGDVRRMLANCDDSVVTGAARTNYLSVVHRENGGEYIRIVAVLANVAGLNVCQVLADRIDAVMAVDTVSRDVQVIEVRR